MNPPPSKGYQGHLADDGHYPPAMHYDSGIRRSNEDRAGTPTVSEYSLHSNGIIITTVLQYMQLISFIARFGDL